MVSLKFKPRLYQETILESCDKNCLVVLPTGLGKTKIAILVAAKRLENYPDSKILFLTPTRPLANQIVKEFRVDTDINNITLFTGEVSPEKRELSWKDSKVIVSTPQCIENDIINNKVPLKEISLIVFDESHRAVKGYSYSFIAKRYVKYANYPRIIGLTASPGSDISTIEEVCKNLYIEEIEVRNEESPDVKDYIQDLEVDNIKVELSDDILGCKKFLDDCYQSKIKEIKELGIINRLDISKGELIGLQGSLQGKLARGERDFEILRGISLIAESIKVLHALELLESQSVESCYLYINRLYDESKKTKVKATKNLVRDLNFKSAYVKIKGLFDEGIEHPKFDKLREVIIKEFDGKSDFKVIIFNHYRDNALKIEREMSKIDGIKPKLFVGQMKKGNTGLSQKKQAEILEKFGQGEYNCLVSTSVGEEGLDIPKVNLVVFYEPIPSAIRSIQRRGRTARHEKGKTVVLITKNSRDEAYFWIAYHKEKRMYRNLEGIRDKIKFKKQKKLGKFVKSEFKVFADSREKGSGVIRKLVEDGLNIEMKRIDINAKEIYNLQDDVDILLQPEFKRENRFQTHLTLGRIKHIKNKEPFLDFLKTVKIQHLNFKIEKINLIQSKLTKDGPKYKIIQSSG